MTDSRMCFKVTPSCLSDTEGHAVFGCVPKTILEPKSKAKEVTKCRISYISRNEKLDKQEETTLPINF